MDLIPPEYSTEIIFDLSVDKEFAYSDRVEEMGFDTHNTLLNLGTLFYILVGNLILVALMLLVHICKCNERFGKYLREKIPLNALFNNMFIIFFEGYVEMGISSYLNMKNAIVLTRSDMFSYEIGYIIGFICITFVPFFVIFVMKVSKNKEHPN